jgi:hypothetical protein
LDNRHKIETSEINKCALSSPRSLVSFFERAPLKRSDDDQEQRTSREQAGKQSHRFFELGSPIIGKIVFALGIFCGLTSPVSLFSNYQIFFLPLYA